MTTATVTIATPSPLWLTNLIRHALMADVTVQAPVRITFPHGYGGIVIEDALVAHRIAQLPVAGSTPCTFTIKKTAPKTAPLTWVTTDDIEDDEGGRRVVRPAVGRHLLVPLLAGQHFHAVATTAAGSGRKHTVWASVFVTVCTHTNGSVTFGIETTGAQTPQQAWKAALEASTSVFRTIIDAADAVMLHHIA